MRTSIRGHTATFPRRRRALVGILLLGITLGGIIGCGNWFSFLMLLCLGTPSLILLLETLTIE